MFHKRQETVTSTRLAARLALAVLLLLVALDGPGMSAGEPGVQVFLVVPPAAQPFEDARERLSLVLKDVQWWYSCQMEAHGYGRKSFPLELDRNGQVRIHLVRLDQRQPEGEDRRIQFKVQEACLSAARKARGDVPKGSVMIVVYNGYIWRNREEHAVWPSGAGAGSEWAFLTAYHYYCICPAAWDVKTPLEDYENPQGCFPDEHVKIMRGHYTYKRSPSVKKRWLRRPVGLHAVMGHGTLAHELGHAFRLSHWKEGEALVNTSIMQGGWVHMRGNFVDGLDQGTCLTVLDAAKLNMNLLFQVREVSAPSTGASREVGMRGVQKAIAAAGTASDHVTRVADTAGQSLIWHVMTPLEAGRAYSLSVQHAVAGAQGAFHLIVWTDTTRDARPDTRVDRSQLFRASTAGQWSEWTFTAPASPVFVGFCWPQKNERVFYQEGGSAPRGHAGFGDTVFYSRSFEGVPDRHAKPRYTNLRLSPADTSR